MSIHCQMGYLFQRHLQELFLRIKRSFRAACRNMSTQRASFPFEQLPKWDFPTETHLTPGLSPQTSHQDEARSIGTSKLVWPYRQMIWTNHNNFYLVPRIIKNSTKILPRKLRVHLAPRISAPSSSSNVCVSSSLRAIKQKQPVLTT